MHKLKSAAALFILLCGLVLAGHAQNPTTGQPQPTQSVDAELDSLRKLDEEGLDSVIITAKYIRYTNHALLKDSTRTVPIDTTLNNFQNYNMLSQPWRPTVGLGNTGIAARDMLFTVRKNIGYDPGFHSLDWYLLTPDSVRYYRARSPFTQLYYINGGNKEQLFRVTHAQNIRPNWNVGLVYNRIGALGIYQNQKGDHTNFMFHNWYEGPNKRYNLLASAVLNVLKAGENGSIVNDSIFTVQSELSGKETQQVRLGMGAFYDKFSSNVYPRQTWRSRSFFVKQAYYLGRIDSLSGDSSQSVLPTQRVTHTFQYATDRYKFFREQEDTFDAFPRTVPKSVTVTNDSTEVSRLSNEVRYSFYLRGKSVKFLKNELKLDVGAQHDLYTYSQLGRTENFQNVTLKANAGYRFSDRVNLEADLQQIVQGRNAGDFLYEATSNILLSRSVGRVVLGAYLLNRSPEQIYEYVNYQFHSWDLNFERTKTTNLSFRYENPRFRFWAKAEYFLLSDYLYFSELPIAKLIMPTQAASNINLLKITAGKDFRFGRFTLQNYVAYQKTDFSEILRTPEYYSYHSFFYSNRYLKSINADLGLDVRYNSEMYAPAYAINVSQFYNNRNPVKFSSYPVADVWLRASLRRATLLLKYSYLNQGLLSRGYFTVNRYPMPDAAFKFGVSWNFYN